MDNDENISWKLIGKIFTFFLLPTIAPFLPSKYSLRTFMIGIVILIVYGAYLLYKYGKKFNEYYKQCDTNKNSIDDHADIIKKHEQRIGDNEKEIENLKTRIDDEKEERRNGDNLINSSIGNAINLGKEYNQSASNNITVKEANYEN